MRSSRARRHRTTSPRDAVQPSHGGGNSDAFVANFDAAGQLVYSTYFGGTGADYGTRVAVDPAGNVAVAGATTSPDLWTRDAIQSSKDGAEDVFIARIAPGTPASDTTAPTTTIDLFGTIGSNGWWRSAINVTLRAVDDENGTGVAFVEYSLNGGAWQLYTGTFLAAAQGTTVVRTRATDRAGNAENPGASSTFMIDWITPAITINSPAAMEYFHTDSLLVSFFATDSLSGLVSATGTIDGAAVSNGQTIPLLTPALGFHTLFVGVGSGGQHLVSDRHVQDRCDDRHTDWRGEYLHRGRTDRRIGWTEPVVEAPGCETDAVAR